MHTCREKKIAPHIFPSRIVSVSRRISHLATVRRMASLLSEWMKYAMSMCVTLRPCHAARSKLNISSTLGDLVSWLPVGCWVTCTSGGGEGKQERIHVYPFSQQNAYQITEISTVCRWNYSAEFYDVIKVNSVLLDYHKIVCVLMALIQNTFLKQRMSWFDSICFRAHILWTFSSVS